MRGRHTNTSKSPFVSRREVNLAQSRDCLPKACQHPSNRRLLGCRSCPARQGASVTPTDCHLKVGDLLAAILRFQLSNITSMIRIFFFFLGRISVAGFCSEANFEVDFTLCTDPVMVLKPICQVTSSFALAWLLETGTISLSRGVPMYVVVDSLVKYILLAGARVYEVNSTSGRETSTVESL